MKTITSTPFGIAGPRATGVLHVDPKLNCIFRSQRIDCTVRYETESAVLLKIKWGLILLEVKFLIDKKGGRITYTL